MRIIIAEDNRDARDILRTVLTAAGHEVVAAENGRIALELAHKHLPDMIISDILMPEMDGFQLCREVRQDQALKETPFVFYTATYTDTKDERLARDLGADNFIRKPLESQDFLDLIQGVVRKVETTGFPIAGLVLDEKESFLKRYNARLIEMLEKKVADLEVETAAHQRTAQDLKATLKAIPDMVFRLDRQGRILDFKPATAYSFYKPSDTIVERTITEVLPDDMGCDVLADVQKALDNGGIVVSECRLPTKGTPCEVEFRCTAASKDEVVILARDVTLERSAHRTLAESEARYRALVESSCDHIFMLSVEGRYLASNHGCPSCSIAETTSVIGKDIMDYHSPDVAIEYKEKLNTVVTTGESISFEHRMDSPEGVHWHLDTLYPIIIEGTISYVGGICRDISEKKAAEASLRLSEAKYRELFENSPDAIAIASIDGRVQDANQAFTDLFGYSQEELVNLAVDQLYIDREDRTLLLEEVRNTGLVKNKEVRLRHKDGSEIAGVTSIAAKYDAQGEIVAMESITRDVTEFRKLQNQLQQSQKLESIGMLAGGVAHDFNNMLSIILGYGEIVFSELHPEDPLRGAVGEILAAGKRSATLTRQLLAFSRKQTLLPEVLDVNGVVHDLENMLRRLIGEDMELVFSPAKELWQVRADPGQIEQVIVNLAANARDAMGQGGKLVIETANVELDASYAQNTPGVVAGEYVLLAISDTGSGMEKQTVAHVFEPFFTTKEPGKGTGLGLATVYGIIKQSGGNIWVYSEPGQGTTFKIYLPRTKGKTDIKHKEVVHQKPSGQGQHILVVEDEESLRKLCKTILSREGYRVTLAANGEEALQLVKEMDSEPDLVITDVVMPNMSGSQLVENLRRKWPDQKVLYMSGYTDSAIVHHGVLEHGIPFINKPFTQKEITAKVHMLMGGAEPVDRK